MRPTSTKAERIHHVFRLKHKRRNYWGYPRYTSSALDHPPVPDEPMDARCLGMVVSTPQLCSCSGCGNTRRHAWFKGDRITLQEKRWLTQYREQLDEVNDSESDLCD
jgi:hypothetical protein